MGLDREHAGPTPTAGGARLLNPMLQRIQRLAQGRRQFDVVQVGASYSPHEVCLAELCAENGWRALLIEPAASLFAELAARFGGMQGIALENVAIDHAAGNRTLYRLRQDDTTPAWAGLLGTFDLDVMRSHAGKIPDVLARLDPEEVRCERLRTLLDRHGLARVDLLAIDAEGYDYEIIKSLDDVEIDFILFEHRHLSDDDRLACFKLLEQRGYDYVEVDFMDALYRHARARTRP